MQVSLGDIHGLGPGPDVASCGENPCGVLDYVYLSDACMGYLGCAEPTNKLYVGATKGGLYVAGQAVGGAVTEVAGGAAEGAAAATGVPIFVWYIGAAVFGFLLLKSAIK